MSALGVEWGCKYVLEGPDGTRAVFNDDTDEDFVGILSPESSGLDSADVREDSQDATEADGGVHGDFYYGRRPVILQGTVIASGAEDRNAKVAKIKAASNALRADATLTWEPVGGPEGGVELKLRRQQPLRITKGWVKDFQIPMVSASAEIFSITKHTFAPEESQSVVISPGSGTLSHIAIHDEFIYFVSEKGAEDWIGRAKLDGTEVNAEFIKTKKNIQSMAVDATYIYFGSTTNFISRVKIDGTGMNESWLATSGSTTGLAVNATHIYWSDTATDDILRATVAGTGTATIIECINNSFGIALDSTYVYYNDGSDIGRAKLDGSEADNSFIDSDVKTSRTIAIDSKNIYWTNSPFEAVGYIVQAPIAGSSGSLWYEPTSPEVGNYLAINNGVLYWTTDADGKIYKMDLAQKVTNAGDAESAPTIKISNEGTAFTLTNVTTNESIVIEYTLTAGNYIEVDFKRHTIKLNGITNIYSALKFESSSWWKLVPGENELILPFEVALTWQDAYL